jgi:hypothetical protein
VISRVYELEVVAKYYGSLGHGSITLRPPSINDSDIDPHRPYWCDRTNMGVPLALDLTPEEMESVTVGDLFIVSIGQARYGR